MTLFYVSAAAFKPLTSKGGIQTFQFIYFFSSFDLIWHSPDARPQALTAQPIWRLAPQPVPFCLLLNAPLFQILLTSCGAGPNCTTFLLAGELYPTEMRTTAHGYSAGFAKLGGLWPSTSTT